MSERLFNPCYEHCYLRFGKEYSPDCDEKCEYAKAVKERDAAVKELERLMYIFGEACDICASKSCTVPELYKCIPKWRGLQQEV